MATFVLKNLRQFFSDMVIVFYVVCVVSAN